MPDDPKKEREPLQRAPTLYLIIIFKILKGLFFAGLALAVYNLSDNNLPEEYKNLLHLLGANPDRKFWTDLATKVGSLTEAKMVHFAIGILIYSMFALVEGVGMMFRAGWAGWLTIGEAAFFIPIEAHHLIQGPTQTQANQSFNWPVFVIMVVNIFIVGYLFKNRAWLFRHHHWKH